jgi:hypothetical protein
VDNEYTQYSSRTSPYGKKEQLQSPQQEAMRKVKKESLKKNSDGGSYDR